MKLSGKQKFISESKDLLLNYPKLKLAHENKKVIIEGEFDIIDEGDRNYGSFKIEVHHCEEYPYRFPILYEVGGKIPHNSAWHINVHDPGPKKSCCVEVLPKELFMCIDGITLKTYFSEILKPYLFNQQFRMNNGFYANKEYQHGLLGIWQFFSDLFPGVSPSQMIELLSLKRKNINKKSKCYCGSDSKFRKCHYNAYSFLKKMPEKYKNLFVAYLKQLG